ncbi:hypothetical protein ACCO45_012618 [Purpureocillium lilacinum]|uniref:Uncharacterized protein n=1 Tax=Purpureocillium lilacinum TaxID=33203 RepID=A0ACC4D8I0_PURLI
MKAVNENFSDAETASQSSNASSIHPLTHNAHPPPRSQLRPQRPTLPFVPYADWAPTQSYDYNPPEDPDAYRRQSRGTERVLELGIVRKDPRHREDDVEAQQTKFITYRRIREREIRACDKKELCGA